MQVSSHSFTTTSPPIDAQRIWRWRGWAIRYCIYDPQQYSDPPPPLPSESAPESVIAPPILFIHGFGSSLDQWARNMKPLSLHRRVYALDLLGFGASEKAAIAYNSDLWVAQIYDFWRRFIGEPMVLIGHSLGALVSATVAIKHPTIVQRLALVTLPNTRQDRVHSPWIQQLVGSVERAVASPLLVRLIFHIARQPGFIRKALLSIYMKRDRVTDELVSQFVTPTLDRGAAQTLCRLTEAVSRPNYSPSRDRLLEEIRQPTLVLWGGKDQVVPLKPCLADIEANPNLTLVTILEGGHCVYDECATDFNQAILDWLS